MDVVKLRSDKVQDSAIKDLQKSQKSSGAKNVDAANAPAADGIKQNINSENVKWSDNAGLFAEALQTAKQAPDVRADKVAGLKAAIKGGTYKVDSHAIADKMLQSAVDENRKA